MWTTLIFLTEMLGVPLCEYNMLAGGKRENTWPWLPGWIFIYASGLNKLAGAEIRAIRLWLLIVVYDHFYYFSMNVSTFGVNFRSSESKPWLYVCLPLLLWEEQKTCSSFSCWKQILCSCWLWTPCSCWAQFACPPWAGCGVRRRLPMRVPQAMHTSDTRLDRPSRIVFLSGGI